MRSTCTKVLLTQLQKHSKTTFTLSLIEIVLLIRKCYFFIFFSPIKALQTEKRYLWKCWTKVSKSKYSRHCTFQCSLFSECLQNPHVSGTCCTYPAVTLCAVDKQSDTVWGRCERPEPLLQEECLELTVMHWFLHKLLFYVQLNTWSVENVFGYQK